MLCLADEGSDRADDEDEKFGPGETLKKMQKVELSTGIPILQNAQPLSYPDPR